MRGLSVRILLPRWEASGEVLLVEEAEVGAPPGSHFSLPEGRVLDIDSELAGSGRVNSSRMIPEGPSPLLVAAAARSLFEATGIWKAHGPVLSAEKRTRYHGLVKDRSASFFELLKNEDHRLESADFLPVLKLLPEESGFPGHGIELVCCPGAPKEQVPLGKSRFLSADHLLRLRREGRVEVEPLSSYFSGLVAGNHPERFLLGLEEIRESRRKRNPLPLSFSCGVVTIPLKTPTKPPSTHTNAYLVGMERLYLVDPASPDKQEQQRLWGILDQRISQGNELAAILLTHDHPDHVGGVEAAQLRYDVPVLAHPLTLARLANLKSSGNLEHGDELELGKSPDHLPGWKLQVYHLPGHAPGHLAFQESRYGSIITGDLLSTLSSILIDKKDGHLATYIESLKFLESVTRGYLYPGHGPPARDGRRLVNRALGHRKKREAQLLKTLSKDPMTLDEVVVALYHRLDPNLMGYARRSVDSGLQKLLEEGQVLRTGEGYILSS